ncbi:MAG: glycosyltransferase [Flavobacterium sp.]|uniref:glycosyltransferase family 2 protein n=1 Tax=Flavobacterium sp. TaxID=239 RepID=UPI0032671CED
MLAIVIPYFKINFFEATLLSLANQTDKRFNVYIGDDASPENPSLVLEKYQKDIDFKYKRFDNNIGSISLVKQWERCMAMTQNEEWIMILCDDDVLGENVVAEFYAAMEEVNQQNINVIRYATVVIDQDSKEISKVYEHPKLEKSTDFLMRKIKGGTRSSLSEFIFRKKVLGEIKFKELPLAWFADYLAVLECTYFGYIYTINKALVYFRLSDINITAKKDDSLPKNIAAFNYYYYLLNKKGSFFNAEQTEILLFRLEKTFLDNKKNINFWLLFTKLYISKMYLKKYGIFIAKIVKSI